MKKNSIILGIDPGTNIMGFGVIEIKGNSIKTIQYGIVNFKKHKNHYLKLKHIYSTTKEIIDDFLPDELAIEAPFYGKNVQSMLKLGRAQGVCMSAALSNDIPIFEYAPKKIKSAITGNGNSSKEQVAKMVENILKINIKKDALDATDALGAAICHHYQKTNTQKSTSNDWSEFIKNNPKRIK